MTLTVIVPDDRPGMQRMLERELQNIDNEILYEDWRSGLEKARGDFILLLEHDSGVNKGSIQRQLDVFMENPHYRKLAMVSPKVEFEDADAMNYTYNSESCSGKTNAHLSRIGYLPGSVIRRSTIKKYLEPKQQVFSIVDLSYEFSIALWENGLRITHEPSCVYEAPGNAAFVDMELLPMVSENVLNLWKQEMIV